MRPIDFILESTENDFNMAAGRIIEALNKPIQIFGEEGEYVILSYYIGDDGNFILDIQNKDEIDEEDAS